MRHNLALQDWQAANTDMYDLQHPPASPQRRDDLRSILQGSAKLCRALLVYGKSDYNGFPYRHPFVVVHDIVRDGDNARLAEGQLVTPDALREMMSNLGQSVPTEILPERVLVRTADTLVWWMPASIRVMFFSDGGGDTTLAEMNGKQYPHPPLIFKASGSLVGKSTRRKQAPARKNGHVYGTVLELRRGRRGLHGQHEDTAREVCSGHRRLGDSFLPKRIHTRKWHSHQTSQGIGRAMEVSLS